MKDKASLKAAPAASNADVIQSQAQFWDIMEKLVAKQLGDNTSTEYRKFMKAFREVSFLSDTNYIHSSLLTYINCYQEFANTADKVNLEDLEAIAANNC